MKSILQSRQFPKRNIDTCQPTFALKNPPSQYSIPSTFCIISGLPGMRLSLFSLHCTSRCAIRRPKSFNHASAEEVQSIYTLVTTKMLEKTATSKFQQLNIPGLQS